MQGPIRENTISWVSVILVDATDGYTRETGIAWNTAGMTVRFQKPSEKGNSTWNVKALTVNDWVELGHGHYQMRFLAAEVGSWSNDYPLEFYIKCDASRPFSDLVWVSEHYIPHEIGRILDLLMMVGKGGLNV